jgi:hypothetical protein
MRLESFVELALVFSISVALPHALSKNALVNAMLLEALILFIMIYL